MFWTNSFGRSVDNVRTIRRESTISEILRLLFKIVLQLSQIARITRTLLRREYFHQTSSTILTQFSPSLNSYSLRKICIICLRLFERFRYPFWKEFYYKDSVRGTKHNQYFITKLKESGHLYVHYFLAGPISSLLFWLPYKRRI